MCISRPKIPALVAPAPAAAPPVKSVQEDAITTREQRDTNKLEEVNKLKFKRSPLGGIGGLSAGLRIK